jgi:HNH endonuclease
MRTSPPSRFSIAEYWHSAEAGWIESLDLPHCFACRYDWFREPFEEQQAKGAWNRSKLERTHIIAKSCGGSFEVSNFLLLCPRCHKDSPMLSNPAAMLDWAKSREHYLVWVFRRLTEELKLLNVAVPDVPVNPTAISALARHMRLDRHPAGDFAFAAWAAVFKEYFELHRIGFRWVPDA